MFLKFHAILGKLPNMILFELTFSGLVATASDNQGTNNAAVNTTTTTATSAGTGTTKQLPKFLEGVLMSPNGSVAFSPQKPGRRQSWGPHMSRWANVNISIYLNIVLCAI